MRMAGAKALTKQGCNRLHMIWRQAWRSGAAALISAALLLSSVSTPAQARKLSLIRDAEIENSIRVWMTPVFDAAGLVPEDIDIILVNDRGLNAFVAGGQKIFIHTGLLERSEHAGQVIGVLAHETGHITGGHLARLPEQYEAALKQSIIGTIIAAAAGIAAGRGDVAVAGIGASQSIAQRNLLSFTRTQESAADQAAVQFLDRSGYSSLGLLEFFRILSSQERRYSATGGNEYLRTHPLTRDRATFVQSHVRNSPYSRNRLPPEFEEQHRRMRGKLIGFLSEDPEDVLTNVYDENDNSIAAYYAKTIAYYRLGRLDRAVPMVDQLIRLYPEDPFFYELKGQMLFENGRIAQSIPPYEQAVRLFPWSGLLRYGLAQAMIEANDPRLLQPAIAHLKEAIRFEPNTSGTWRLLTIAYGRQGDQGNLALAQAEIAYIQCRLSDAQRYAERAEQLLPAGSPGQRQAQEIMTSKPARCKKKK